MPRIGHYRRPLLALALVAPAWIACADPSTAPRTASELELGVVSSAGPPATISWQATARDLVSSHPAFSPLSAARLYALLGVAQYGAVVSADFGGGRAQYEARRGAVAGASAQVLSYLVPDAAAAIEQQLIAEGNAGPGGVHPHFTRGVAKGRAMGEVMKEWARTDGFVTPWNGVLPPTGPGLWMPAPNVAPAGFQLPTMRPYYLTSQSQFRAAAPPAFGSADFLAALDEVRDIAATRTAHQVDVANFWNLPAGTPQPPGYWIGKADELARAHALDEREAAHLFALVSSSLMDAVIGCWDSKYHYLVIRPSQADPTISRVYPLPNHPSYPSGHSCGSAAAASVLADWFPSHAAELDALVAEAGVSRVWGGIHYSFDVAAGQVLGRAVAEWARAYDAQHGLLAAIGQAALAN